MESKTNEGSIENFSKLTYRQRFAITEYGYLLSPEDAEVVGKMLGNLQEQDVLPFCQANGKKVSGRQETTSVDMTQISIAKSLLALENQEKAGVNWFFWIAGLSILNSVIFFAGGSITFMMGLGATQFIDVVSSVLTREVNSGAATFVRVLGFGLDLLFAGIFATCGVLGRKRFRWAIITGMVLYTLDALISLLLGAWLSTLFHVFALTGLWRGLRAITKLTLAEKNQTSGDIASLQKLTSSQPPTNPTTYYKNINRFALIIIIPTVLLFAFLLLMLWLNS